MTATHEQLSEAMDFDHPVRITVEGEIESIATRVYAPDMLDDELESGSEWKLLRGYTGQYSYNGPTMHASEQIGGALADDILSNPGVYVALVSFVTLDDDEEDEDNTAGWAIARLID